MSTINPNEYVIMTNNDVAKAKSGDRRELFQNLVAENQKLADQIVEAFPEVEIMEVLAIAIFAKFENPALAPMIAAKFKALVTADFKLGING